MKVSVIITTYKGADTLPRAIQSVLKQTTQDFEILVVDDNADGSQEKNDTRRVVESFQDERIRYFETGHVNGSYARNIGIRNASGDYISFLDDDDYYLPKRLERCLETAASNSNCAGVYTAGVLARRDTILGVFHTYRDEELQKKVLITREFGTGSNLFLQRNAMAQIGEFDDTFLRFQDIEYMVRFLEKYNIAAIDEHLFIKFDNGGCNIPSGQKFIDALRRYIDKFQPLIDRLSENDKREFYQVTVNQFYRMCFRLKTNDKELVKYYRTCVKECGVEASFSVRIKTRLKRVMPMLVKLKGELSDQKYKRDASLHETVELIHQICAL